MLEIIGITVTLLLILFYCGYGASILLLPEKLKPYAFWIIPWNGTIVIVLTGVITSLAHLPISQSKYLLMALPLIFLLMAVFSRSPIRLAFPKDSRWLIGTCLLLLGLYLYPLLQKVGFATSFSTSNVDVITYVHVADFLTDHTVYDGNTHIPFKPYIWATGDWLHHSYRWGSPILLGMLADLLNLKTFQIFSIMIVIYFTLTLPLIYISFRILGGKRGFFPILILVAVYSLNSTLFFILFNTFFAQIVFTGLFLLIFIVGRMLITEKKASNKSVLWLACGLSSISAIYPEGYLFPLSALVILACFRLIKHQSPMIVIQTILCSFLLNPITAIHALIQNANMIIKSVSRGPFGFDYLPLIGPFNMMGFYNLVYSRSLPYAADFLLGTPVILVCLYGLKKIHNRWYLLSFLATPLALYLFFLIQIQKFTLLRTVTYALFLVVIPFCIGLLAMVKNHGQMAKVVILAVIYPLALRSAYRSLYQLYWHPLVVDKSLVSLTELNQNQAITEPFFTADVYLGEYNLWRRLWQEYLLSGKNIVSRQNFSYEKARNLDDIELVLAEKNKLEHEGKGLVFTQIVWQNEYYQMGYIEPLQFDPLLPYPVD